LRLGFACNWNPTPEATWSGTPSRLMASLGGYVDTVDVGLHLPRSVRRGLQLLSLRRVNGRWVPQWEHSQSFERGFATMTAARVRRARCDAVLEIQDVGVVPAPFFIYQDMSYDALAAEFAKDNSGARLYFRSLTSESLERRRQRQREIYEHAAGVIAMSKWFARSLVDRTGLPPAMVHVASPGATALRGGDLPPPRRREPPRWRLLFVGTDFFTKGGDVVVSALAELRRDDPSVTLTVAGPRRWPMAGSLPAGVRFLGRVTHGKLIELYDSHDLLVMPSRFEAFGIVFVEALGRGLPCVGRRAFAMPEIITSGRNGALVDDDSPGELAASIAKTLSDDEIYEYAFDHSEAVTQSATWDATACRVVQIMNSVVR
jgi:glycosyltransferase involved in cell wall biosynthesis